MPATNRNRGHVPLKDYYSIADVSALLGIGENEVRRLAERPSDPLPFRRLSHRLRGMFIARRELMDWIQRNTVLVAFVKDGDSLQAGLVKPESRSDRTRR